MAYGKGQPKEVEKRMAELGRVQTSVDLGKLRVLILEACGKMADDVWPVSITTDIPSGKNLDVVMLATQAGLKGMLNSVWAEKARLIAKSAVLEQWRRARENLFGRFKNISTVGDKPMKDGRRRLVNLPEEWSSRLTETDIASLQTFADSLDFSGAMTMFRKLSNGHVPAGLTTVQGEALTALLAVVQERFGKPTWRAEDAVVQLHLDFRCFVGVRPAMESLLGRLTQAANQSFGIGAAYTTSFLIAGVVARGAPLKLTALVLPGVVQRLLEPVPSETEATFTSLVVEVGPAETVTKGVLTQQPAPFTLSEATHLVGSDFGLVNTVAAALVQIDAPLDAEWLNSVKDWTKAQSKAYLESHWHDGEPVSHLLFSGRNFLSRINQHAEHIDRLRAEIDRGYTRLGRLKHEANRILGRPSDTALDQDMGEADNERLVSQHQRFFKLLAVIGRLKLLRRQVYRVIDGLKRSWFGFVTTKLAQLCRDNKAAYVREDLTILAEEKASSTYKGRTFNKLLNNGSKGQFLRRMSAKLQWYGIPEIVVPSFYTSSTDVRHSCVDGKQRRGEVFTAKVDGRKMHADVHAALTLALWPILRLRQMLVAAT